TDPPAGYNKPPRPTMRQHNRTITSHHRQYIPASRRYVQCQPYGDQPHCDTRHKSNSITIGMHYHSYDEWSCERYQRTDRYLDDRPRSSMITEGSLKHTIEHHDHTEHRKQYPSANP